MRRGTAFLAILRKDLLLYSRDHLFLALTVLGVTTFVVLYYVLPAEVAPAFTLGVRGTGLMPIFEELAAEEEEAIPLEFFETGSELRTAVEQRTVDVGIDFPPDLLERIRTGEQATVTVYASPTLPVEYRDAVSTMVREIAFAIAGFELPVTEPDEQTVILGPDAGPIPIRDRMRPLFAFWVLIMEAIALGSLISAEVQQKTIGAILVTPARVSDVLFSKGVIGTFVAFSEAAIVLLIIRGFGTSPGVVTVALLLGAVLVTSIAMIAGAAGRDLFGTMVLGIIMLIPLAIPSFSVLFPGSVAGWVRLIPSYGLVATIMGSSVYGAGWSESLPELAMLAGWCVVFAAVGMFILQRRVTRI